MISIRLRLTLWYTGAVTLLLAVVAVSLTLVHERISLGRLDTELHRLNDALATVLVNELNERPNAGAAAEEALIEVVVPGRHLAILSREGAVLAQRWTLPVSPAIDFGRGEDRTSTIDAAGRIRTVTRSIPPVPDGFAIVTAASWDELYDERANLLRAMMLVIPAALLVAASGAWWVAGRALRPAAAMAAEASRLSERSTGRRLTVARQDELGRLAIAFNDLVGRLEEALAVRRRFLADASHELRTPVSIASTAADVALSRRDRSDAEYRDALDVVSKQMKHLGRIVADMLTLARSDAADWPIATTDFYFDELVGDAVQAMNLLSKECGVPVELSCPAELQVRGDEGLLHQMLVNVLENAIRHTPHGGRVRVDVAANPSGVAVSVRDTGHGIADEDRERIFERFVHIPAPGRTAGSGLGLAIARRIARAHAGDLTLVSTGPTGTHFGIALPILSNVLPSAAPTSAQGVKSA